MGFTVAAFGESIDSAGAYTNITAVSDQHLRTNGDDLIVPDSYSNIVGALAFLESTADEEARLESPSLRRINPLMIPTAAVVAGLTEPRDDAFWPQAPVPLVPDEALNALIKSNPAAATSQSVVCLLSDGALTPQPGPVYRVEFTVTVTSVEDTWTFAQIAFTTDLPAGRYSVRGARLQGAAAIAFRFVPVGSQWRPGGFVSLAEDDRESMYQRSGMLGEWFQFDQNQPPGIEILAADTAGAVGGTGVLDVVPL